MKPPTLQDRLEHHFNHATASRELQATCRAQADQIHQDLHRHSPESTALLQTAAALGVEATLHDLFITALIWRAEL